VWRDPKAQAERREIRDLHLRKRPEVRRSEARALIVALVAALPVASAAAGADAPILLTIDPASVRAHRPTTLTLVGSGFQPGASVLIESGRSGKFLRYRPKKVESDRCVVSVPSGLPARPSEVAIFVENPDGMKSDRLSLAVELVPTGVDGTPESAEDRPEPENDSGSENLVGAVTAPDRIVPTIRELRPPAIRAGRPVILEILGSGFGEDSKVLVTANIHAGTSRLPEYAPRPFPIYFIDAELIEVEFDLGFYPIPGARDVVVENPSGGRSQPAILEILQDSTEQED